MNEEEREAVVEACTEELYELTVKEVHRQLMHSRIVLDGEARYIASGTLLAFEDLLWEIAGSIVEGRSKDV